VRLLLIEDDEKIASFIVKGLKEAGFTTDHALDGVTGLGLALNEDYDGAIVDIMLPGLDGLSIIETLRKRGINLPVIILSARRSVDDRIRGLQQGGDDYLTKPFAFSELLARIQALLRRASNTTETTTLTVEDLSIDLLARTVTRSGQAINLQPKEFSLLEYLMRNTGRVVSKTMIMERVWDYNFDPQTNVVEARICRLRDKIDKNFDVPLIHTVRGLGYVLKKEHA
jgi:two-component system OmpR family response regulator